MPKTGRRVQRPVSRGLPGWLFLVAGVFLLALAAYALLGIYARYQGDDFCYENVLGKYGFWASNVYWYTQWSNRFTTTMVLNIGYEIGPFLDPFISAGVLLSLLLGLTSLLRQVFIHFPRGGPFILASSLGFLMILQAPNLYQILYWRQALVTYFLSLIIFVWLAAFLINRIRREQAGRELPALIFTLVAFFINGGFSETTVALQASVLIISMGAVAVWLRDDRRRPAFRILLAALAGSLIAMAVILLSPGNDIRLSYIHDHPSLMRILVLVLRFPFAFIYHLVLEQPASLVVAPIFFFAVAFLIRRQYGRENPVIRKPVRMMLMVGVVCFVLLAAVCAPSAYGYGAYPEDRVLINALFLVDLTIMVEAGILGYILADLAAAARSPRLSSRSGIIMVVLLVCCALLPLQAAWNALNEMPAFSQRAQLLDARDLQLRQAAIDGQMDVIITGIDSVAGIMEMGPDPGLWVNVCAAGYYGLNTIQAENP